ncbi:MAG: hypothetical protein WBL36_03085 [Bacilli bacterium]
MKRIVVLFLLMMIAICGCADKLKPPDNITFDGDVLSWDAVKGADSYRIIIEDEIYSTTETTYDLTFLADGAYDVYLCALKGNQASPYSDQIRIIIKRSLTVNMRVTGGNVVWDEIESALSYVFYVDGVETETIDTESVPVSGLNLETNKIYMFQVKAVFANNASPLSSSYYHHTYETVLDLEAVEIKLPEKKALSMDFAGAEIVAAVAGNQVFENYVIQDGKLEIPYAEFQGKKPGNYQYLFFTEDTAYWLPVTVAPVDRPYIISNTVIDYQPGMDIVLLVELAGGSFNGLMGNEISADDYQFLDSRIIINHAYIDRMIAKKPDRKTLVLLYTLKKDNTNIIGDIFINLQNSEIDES